MSVYKRDGSPYWNYEFMFRGERVRESTKQTNKDVARQMEAAHRTRLAKGEVGIVERKHAPTLKAFLRERLLPVLERDHAAEPNTVVYYQRGARYLTETSLADVRLDQITAEHSSIFAGEKAKLSASSINCGLRLLRIALYSAEEWGVLGAAPRIKLAKGERKRKRVLTSAEKAKYLAACSGSWLVIATILLNTGMRPGEVLALRWESGVDLSGKVVSILEGKTDNAERELPMREAVHNAIRSHWEAAGRPSSGWVFPGRNPAKHAQLSYTAHRKAMAASGVPNFVPYTMRHTTLTNLAKTTDGFTLMKIAGHGSLAVTERYIHPEQETVNAAFGRMAS